MSRPLKSRVPLAAVLGVRVPVDVAKRWREQAATRRLSISDWLRQAIEPESVRVVGMIAAPKMTRRRFSAADPQLLLAVARVGNNCNQLAHAVHARAVRSERIDALRCLHILAEIQRELAALIDVRATD